MSLVKPNKTQLLFAVIVLTLVVSTQCLAPSVSVTPKESRAYDDPPDPYGTGILSVNPDWNLNLYYAWVNINETRVIFLALFSDIYPSPIMTFLAQQYNAANGTEVFVGHSFLLFEVFNDTNGNGVPDADYSTTPAESEIYYYMELNASQSFEYSGMTTTTIEGCEHYQWSMAYVGIQAALLFPEPRMIGGSTTNLAAMAFIERVGFAFDFSIQGNITYLKTDFDIGNTTIFPVHPEYNPTLEGLSLSALYGTTMTSATELLVHVNDVPYDSRSADPAPTLTNSSEIVEGTTSIYDLRFGYNYTWFSTPTGIEVPEQTAACANASIHDAPSWRGGVALMQDSLDSVSTAIDLPTTLTIDPDASPLLYRICYPLWSGFPILHDPLYKAYINEDSITPPPPPPPPPPLFLHPAIVGVAILGTLLLVVAMLSLSRTRRTKRKYYYEPEPS